MYQAGYPARIMNTGQSLLHHNRGAGCVAVNGRYAGLAISRSQPKLLVTGLTLSVQDPVAHNVEALNNFQPTVLGGYSSAITALAHEANAGRLNISPRMVVTTAEKRTEEMFSDIEEAWPGRQVNFYASTECPLVAVQHGQGLYRICDDIVLLELLDDQHVPVEEGETGSIVLTPLHNRVLPLIRYQMLDMAERGPNQEDGPFTTFTKIHGRVNDTLPIVLDNGEPGTLSPIVLCGFAAPGLKKAKFVLTAPDQIEVRYMSDHEIDMVVREAFRKVLKASGAANAMRLEVKRVYALPPDPQTGKFRITEIQI